jgi:hypothetical protein
MIHENIDVVKDAAYWDAYRHEQAKEEKERQDRQGAEIYSRLHSIGVSTVEASATPWKQPFTEVGNTVFCPVSRF